MKIGIIGSKLYNNNRKIKDTIYELKRRFGDTLIIVSGGGKDGTEKYVKKYALELGCKYSEYNPAHTIKNLYSALNERYYGKPYKVSHFHHRNRLLAKGVDYLIAFIPPLTASMGVSNTIKEAKKYGKKVVIIY